MKRIGERIKRKRELMGIHLGDLAREVGISASALSQIERAKAFPSIITIKSIAEHLDTTVSELIGESDHKSDTSPVVRRGEEKLLEKTDDGAFLFGVDHHFLNKQMHPFIVELRSDAEIADILKGKVGQIFILVLKGSVGFVLDHEKYHLDEGDSIYFSSRVSNNAKNIGKSTARILVVISPPAF